MRRGRSSASAQGTIGWIAARLHGVVALAETGDKTQLQALVLAARFRKPLPIVLGILVATLLDHGLAGALGAWITWVVEPDMLRWVLGLSFIGTTLGMLIGAVPSVFVGDKLSNGVSMRLVRGVAAGIFAALGVAALFGVDIVQIGR